MGRPRTFVFQVYLDLSPERGKMPARNGGHVVAHDGAHLQPTLVTKDGQSGR